VPASSIHGLREGHRRVTPIIAALGWVACTQSLDFDELSYGKIPTPVAYWPLEDDGADRTGDHDATIDAVEGSPRFTAGHSGRGLAFLDQRGALVVDSLSGASFPKRGALAIWTRADELPTSRHRLFGRVTKPDNPSAPSPFALSLQGDRFIWGSTASDKASFIEGAAASRWALVVAEWDVSARRRVLYVRQERGASAFREEPLDDAPDVSSEAFTLEHPAGVIDEVRLFDRVLERKELDALD
jgi:hypothetical protein